MSWLQKALWWAWSEGRDRGRGLKVQTDLQRLLSIIPRALPNLPRPELGRKIVDRLREVWEDGEASQPSHVPQYGLSLYSRTYLNKKIEELWKKGMAIEAKRDFSILADAYAFYIVTYYMSVVMLDEGISTSGQSPTWVVRQTVKSLCEGVPDPFPHFP